LFSLSTKLGETGSVCFPPSVYKPLLKALSANSQVCGLLHPEEDLEVLLKIVAGSSTGRDFAAMDGYFDRSVSYYSRPGII
jgi:hypothetical protein